VVQVMESCSLVIKIQHLIRSFHSDAGPACGDRRDSMTIEDLVSPTSERATCYMMCDSAWKQCDSAVIRCHSFASLQDNARA